MNAAFFPRADGDRQPAQLDVPPIERTSVRRGGAEFFQRFGDFWKVGRKLDEAFG
jgi:hypothetical protein